MIGPLWRERAAAVTLLGSSPAFSGNIILSNRCLRYRVRENHAGYESNTTILEISVGHGTLQNLNLRTEAKILRIIES